MSINSISQPDITLLLDTQGVIQKATLSKQMARENLDSWVGRPWDETVADVGGDKVRRMIQDARTSGVSSFRQVNQLFPSGRELPMEYTAVRLGGKSGLIAIGKNLRAVAELQARLVSTQQTMERDYWKLREVEARYKHLFEASDEAVLILNAGTLRIADANPAAIHALSLSPRRREDVAANRDFLSELSQQDRSALQAMLRVVREQGKAPATVVRLGRDRKRWVVRGSLMKSEPDALLLVRLALVSGNLAESEQAAPFSVEELIERLPDGFVIVDMDGVIRRANRAFLEMIEIKSKANAIGERLGRWLWRPGADLTQLVANVRRNGAARLFSTTMHGELGSETDVELSAVGNADGKSEHIGVLIRDVSRRFAAQSDNGGLLSALGPISEQIGRTSLRKLVEETTTIVESHYVTAALQLAGGNRTAAAEILGLSRQSLYAKLARYQLEKEAEAEP